MTLKKVQNKALQLPISDRFAVVQCILNSIQQEMLLPASPNQTMKPLTDPVPPLKRGVRGDLDPWTQSLIGVSKFTKLFIYFILTVWRSIMVGSGWVDCLAIDNGWQRMG